VTLAEHTSTRVECVALALDRTPQQVLLALRDEPGLFALVGDWAGGGAMVGSRPLAVVAGRAATFDVLAQPELVAERADAVGGGWFGYLGYGLAHDVEDLPTGPPRPVPIPRGRLAFHDHVLRLDSEGAWWFEALVTETRRAALDERLADLRLLLAAPAAIPRPVALDGLSPRAPGWSGHTAAVAEGVERIAAGEIFQANLCMRFDGRLTGAAVDAFASASERLQPAYGAFFDTGAGAVVSFSPELFLRRRGRHVETAPIKGTALRSPDPVAAAAERDGLLASAKDAAEHVMIVDLMRNDLGRVCASGTVTAAETPDVEAHPGVWHLVSHVRGELRPGANDADLLRATFPPGSVTGAPKVQALKVISELEATSREVYTGAIGFASPAAGLELSVAIRTFEAAGDRVWLGVGGGIVADSDPLDEAREVWRKAAPLVRALGGELAEPVAASVPDVTRRVAGRLHPRPDPAAGLIETLAVRDGRVEHLDAHLDRLTASVATCFGLEPPHDLADVARSAATAAGWPLARLRIRAVPHGDRLDVTAEVVEATMRPAGEVVPLEPLGLAGGLGEHKWADRRLVDAASHDGGTPLLVDFDGQVLEAGWANVWVLEGERLTTPPVDGRLLPGVIRAVLPAVAGGVGTATAQEPVTLERLASADAVLLSSSVSLVSLGAVDGRAPDEGAVDLVVALRAALLGGS
jgi:para-aminobenzoate synthetase/4-amino-4-deoxychorismate lyase